MLLTAELWSRRSIVRRKAATDARNDTWQETAPEPVTLRHSHVLNPPTTGTAESAICTSNNPERSLDMLMIQAGGRQAGRGPLLGDLRRGRSMSFCGTSVVLPVPVPPITIRWAQSRSGGNLASGWSGGRSLGSSHPLQSRRWPSAAGLNPRPRSLRPRCAPSAATARPATPGAERSSPALSRPACPRSSD